MAHQKMAYITIKYLASWSPAGLGLPKSVDEKTFEEAVDNAINKFINEDLEAQLPPDEIEIETFGF